MNSHLYITSNGEIIPGGCFTIDMFAEEIITYIQPLIDTAVPCIFNDVRLVVSKDDDKQSIVNQYWRKISI